MVSGPPRGEVDVPNALLPLFEGHLPKAVWHNELGGLTFEVAGQFFVKRRDTPSDTPSLSPGGEMDC